MFFADEKIPLTMPTLERVCVSDIETGNMDDDNKSQTSPAAPEPVTSSEQKQRSPDGNQIAAEEATAKGKPSAAAESNHHHESVMIDLTEADVHTDLSYKAPPAEHRKRKPKQPAEVETTATESFSAQKQVEAVGQQQKQQVPPEAMIPMPTLSAPLQFTEEGLNGTGSGGTSEQQRMLPHYPEIADKPYFYHMHSRWGVIP